MFLTLKETGLSFGQEGQRPDACENSAQGGFSIDFVLTGAGKLQFVSRTHGGGSTYHKSSEH